MKLRWLIPLVLTSAFAARALAQEAMLPNPKLTPGRVAASEKDQRGVTAAMEQKVFKRYRLPWSRRAEFKIDHLIPLELGGADRVDNLWPQKAGIKPYGPARKEQLTEVLLMRIKRGEITLDQAQKQISRDWIDAYIDHLAMVSLR